MRASWLVVLGLVGACGMAPPPATEGDAQRAGVELGQLQEGRRLLVQKCGGCHRTPLPADHHPGDWPSKIGDMAARAHVDFAQRQKIETYLVTLAH